MHITTSYLSFLSKPVMNITMRLIQQQQQQQQNAATDNLLVIKDIRD